MTASRRVEALHVSIAACALVVATLSVGCSQTAPSVSAAGGSVDPRKLISERCTKCHSTDRINLAEHDKAGWQATIDRMVARGAQLNETEKAALVEFLAARKP